MAKFNPVPTGRVEDSVRSLQIQPIPDERDRNSEFARGLESGVRSLKSIGRGAVAAGAAIVGADEFAEEQLEKSRFQAEEAAAAAPRVTDIRQVKSLTDITDWMQGITGQQLPIMATLALGGPAALTARALVARQISQRAAVSAGIGASGAALETGAIFPEVVEEAETSGGDQSLQELATTSAAFGTAAGSLEALPIFRLFDRMGVGAAARNSIRKSLGRQVAEGVLEQSALEAGTEMAQTAIERSARKFVNDNFEVFDEEGIGEILNAGAAGGFIGGVMGGVGGALSPVDQEISDIEAEDQLNTLRSQKQLDNLSDIQEIRDELNELQSVGLDHPDVQDRLDELGVIYNKGIKGKRGSRAIIKNKALDDLNDEEIDAIRQLALGEKELTAPLRKVLAEIFGTDDTVDEVLGDVFEIETGKSIDKLDDYVMHRQAGSPLADESRLMDPEDFNDRSEIERYKLRATYDEGFKPTKAIDPVTGKLINTDMRLYTNRSGDTTFVNETTGEELRYITTAGHGLERGNPNILLEVNNKLSGRNDTSNTLMKRLEDLRAKNEESEYEIVPFGQALREEMEHMGLTATEINIRLAERAAKEFNRKKNQKVSETYNPENPIAFLDNFGAIKKTSIPMITRDQEQFTKEELRERTPDRTIVKEDGTSEVVKGNSLLFRSPRQDGGTGKNEFQVSKDGETFNVKAPILVSRMLKKQGADLGKVSVDEIATAFFSAIASFRDRHGISITKGLKPDDRVFQLGERIVTFGDIVQILDTGGKRIVHRGRKVSPAVRRPPPPPEGAGLAPILDKIAEITASPEFNALDDNLISERRDYNNKVAADYRAISREAEAEDEYGYEYELRDPGERAAAAKMAEQVEKQDPGLIAESGITRLLKELHATIKETFKNDIPRDVDALIDNPELRDLYLEYLQDIQFYSQELNASGGSSISDDIVAQFEATPVPNPKVVAEKALYGDKGQYLSDVAALFENIRDGEFKNRLKLMGGGNVSPEAAAEMQKRVHYVEDVVNQRDYEAVRLAKGDDLRWQLETRIFAKGVSARNAISVGEVRDHLAKIAATTEAMRVSIEETLPPQSENVYTFHAKENQVLKGWSELLGIPMPTLVAPDKIMKDARALRIFSSNEEWAFVDPDEYAIYINPYIESPALRLENLAHEFGHLILLSQFNEAQKSGAMDAMFKEWSAWREAQAGKSMMDIFKGKKSFAGVAEVVLNGDPDLMNQMLENMDAGQREYVLDFQEWFADNVVRWMHTSRKPQSVVEKFFADLADMIKRLFHAVKDGGYYPAKTVEQFLDSIVIRNQEGLVNVMNMISYQDVQQIINQKGIDADAEDLVTGVLFSKSPYSRYASESLVKTLTFKLSVEEKAVLSRAFNAPYVRNQMMALLDGYPDEQAKVARDPIRMFAYGFKFWKAGKLELGPKTKDLFTTINDYFSEMFGLVQDHENAAAIFTAIKNRRVHKGSWVVEKRTRDTRLKRGYDMAEKAYKRLTPFIDKVFSSADGRMHQTNNPALIKIATMINTHAGDNRVMGQSMMEDKRTNYGKFLNMWHNRLNTVSNETAKEALEMLQNESLFLAHEGHSEAKQLASSVHNLMAEFRKYLISKGAYVGDRSSKKTGGYFPWVFDTHYMQEHADEFRELLSRNTYVKDFERIVLSINERRLERTNAIRKEKGWPPTDTLKEYTTKDDVISAIISSIADSDGLADVELLKAFDETVPYMGAMNTRVLNFLSEKGTPEDQAVLAKFFDKNLDHTITTYLHQGVKHAEYTSRFGAKGEVLKGLLAEARSFGATQDDLRTAGMYVEAALGTLGRKTNEAASILFGYDAPEGQIINPGFRKFSGALMVAQNLAVLSLATFTSLVDPVGIAVRSGNFKALGAALSAGLDEVIVKATVSKRFNTLAEAKAYVKSQPNGGLVEAEGPGYKVTDRTKLRKLAEALGTIETRMTNEALEWEYGGTWLDPKTKWVNEKFFNIIGLTSLTRLTRVMALAGGEEFLKTHMAFDNDTSKRLMRELELREGDIKVNEHGDVVILTAVERSEITDPEELARDDRVRNALNRFVDEAILRPNAAMRPIWASDPHFALVFHLKSFMYAFHERILRRVMMEAEAGNFAPMGMLLLFVPGMMAADLARDMFKAALGDDKAFDKDISTRAWNAVQRSGTTGLGQMYIDMQNDIQFGGAGIESFMGPAAQNVLFQLDDLFFDNDSGRWSAITDNLPFQNSAGIAIEQLFVDEGLQAANRQVRE